MSDMDEQRKAEIRAQVVRAAEIKAAEDKARAARDAEAMRKADLVNQHRRQAGK